MMGRILMGGLLILLAIQLTTLFHLGASESSVTVKTMPILTPVSLDYERRQRQGEEPVDIHRVINAATHINPKQVPQAEYEQFVADRMEMLSLRNRRHELNVRLMEAGVGLLEILTLDQWTFIQSQRDAIQAEQESEQLQRILEKWGQ